MDLTIDKLKSIAIKIPNRAGSGYVKLPVNIDGQYFAFRFYSEKYLPRTNDQIHTHTYNFHSKTIKGTLRNIIYDVVPTDEPSDFYLTAGICRAGEFDNPETVEQNVSVIEKEQFTTSPGEEYTLENHIFHRIAFDTEAVITLLRPMVASRDAPKNCCQYVIDRKIGPVDPWEEKLTVPQCWEIISECLNESST